MNPIRVFFSTTLTLLLSHALAAPCSAQTGPPSQVGRAKDGPTCKVYSLAELAQDADMGAWIARTVPEVIQPGSWKVEGGSGVISYFGPSKTLVVYHTAAVHMQVEAFLQSVRKTMPAGAVRGAATATSTTHQGVMPAQFVAPPVQQAAVAAKSAYPIPAPMQQPKHLFHFIIRYEGDGALDAGVAALAKVLGGDTSTAEESDAKAAAEPAKAGSISQLFNIILRYEGDGIIDENVASLIKAMQGGFSGPTGSSNCAPADPLVGRGTVNSVPNAPTYVQPPQSAPAGSTLTSPPTTKSEIPTTPATGGSIKITPAAPGSSANPMRKAPPVPAGSGTIAPAPGTAPRPLPAAKAID